MNILRLGREPPSLYHWTVALLVLAAALSALGFSAQATSAFGLDGEYGFEVFGWIFPSKREESELYYIHITVLMLRDSAVITVRICARFTKLKPSGAIKLSKWVVMNIRDLIMNKYLQFTGWKKILLMWKETKCLSIFFIVLSFVLIYMVHSVC